MNTSKSLLSRSVLLAMALLLCVTILGQVVYAETTWPKFEEPKQLNKPTTGTDDGGQADPPTNPPGSGTDDGAGPEPPSNPGGNQGGGGAGALLNMLLLLLR